jgi:hypothetical protein
MTWRVFVLRPPHVFAVVPCPECARDVFVRWPECWSQCARCGQRTAVPGALTAHAFRCQPEWMRVAVLRLFEAIKKTAWKHGFFAPERVRHEVNADGSHRIEVTLRSDGCCDASPGNAVCVASGSACAANSTCSAGSCGACGGAGQPCCGLTGGNSAGTCTAPYLRCNGPNTLGTAPPNAARNTCVACGQVGEPCCIVDGSSFPTFYCVASTCFSTGNQCR